MASLLDLEEWHEFRLRYQFDIVGFARDALNVKLTHQQVDMVSNICLPGSRTSVSSGHGTGKTRSMAIVALWHLFCFPNSVTMFTAPQIQQLRNQTWKEISICYTALRSGPYAWLADHLVILAEKVYIKGHDKDWHVLAKTAPKHSPTNIAGQHGDHLLLWADEASGIEDKIFDTLLGALTHWRNRMVLTSQPTRNSGFLYDTQHSLCTTASPPGPWVALRLNSELSPIVDTQFLANSLLKYGGRDSPQYMVRVLGEFPDLTGEFLVSRRDVESCYRAVNVIPDDADYGYVITVDVGGGKGRDSSVILVCRVWGDAHFGEDARRVELVLVPVFDSRKTEMELANRIDDLMASYPSPTLVVDVNGVGAGLGQMLTQRGLHFIPVNWGGECFDAEARDMYRNKRSQAFVCLSRAIEDGRLGIFDSYGREQATDQLSRMPYQFDQRNRWFVLPKEQAQKKGIKSPDFADALAFAFLDDVRYIPAGNQNSTKATRVQESLNNLASLAATVEL